MNIQLPGGLWTEEGLRRDFAFAPITGRLELCLAEAGSDERARPFAVTEVLAAALSTLAGARPASDRVRALSVPDRHFLLRRLQILLGQGLSWREERCQSCGQVFDFQLDLGLLPVVPAGPGYPFVGVACPGGEERFRVPTGADQEAIALLPAGEEAELALLRRCWSPLEPCDGAARWAAILSGGEALFARIEEALSRVAPAVTVALQAPCPECGGRNEVEVDPHEILRRPPDDLFGEVHRLASHYHWSEREILKLQRPRRQRYLRLIDAARGFSQ